MVRHIMISVYAYYFIIFLMVCFCSRVDNLAKFIKFDNDVCLPVIASILSA